MDNIHLRTNRQCKKKKKKSSNNGWNNHQINIIDSVSFSPAGSCDGYANITEPWRNRGFTSTSFTGFPKTDTHLVNNWWRFTGIGGDRVVVSCIAQRIGGTYYPIRIAFSYPTTESLNPTTGYAYAYYSSCTGIAISVSVALCPGGFYVFKPASHGRSDMAYITRE